MSTRGGTKKTPKLLVNCNQRMAPGSDRLSYAAVAMMNPMPPIRSELRIITRIKEAAILKGLHEVWFCIGLYFCSNGKDRRYRDW